MYGSKPLNVYVGGHRYGGWYEVDHGQVLVSSAWGSRPPRPLGRRKPEAVAKEVLEEIVTTRHARR